MAMPYSVMEMMDYRLYSWPGRGLPEDASGMQFIEGEYMNADEYDDLIRLNEKYLPYNPTTTSHPLIQICLNSNFL